jgi:Ca-activated chloride channel family protein
MRLRRGVAAALALTATTLAAADRPRFSASTDLVVLSATATDKRGRPIIDLRPEEFRVYEEGRPQKIQHFSGSRDSAARILLLVDASGSMNGALKTTSTRMALVQILNALAPQDEAALAAFDHRYWGVVQFTTDRKKILTAYDEIEPFSSTALHDALSKAAEDLASHGEGRRAVVVLTDGVDTASSLQPDQALARSQALDVPIYAVTVLSPLDDPASPRYLGGHRPAAATAGTQTLSRYAALSGGAAFTVSEFGPLRKAAEQIVQELKHQYRLGYDPPTGPTRFRRIQVLSTRKGVVVKTRSGYVPRT